MDGLQVGFDDERVVCDAGVVLVATLARRLGVEELAQRLVRLRRERPGAANAERKVALICAMVLGADSIDDTGLLRAGRTRRLLGGWVPAPSTLGTFWRAFTFGHVRQLDALLGQALERAWKAGAGPSAALIDGLVAAAGPGSGSQLALFQLCHQGGALARALPGAGARAAMPGDVTLFAGGVGVHGVSSEGIEATLAAVDEAARGSHAGYYPNFVEAPADASAFFDGETWRRLRQVKALYDPDDLFRGNHHIPSLD
jgi:hypothetical protein